MPETKWSAVILAAGKGTRMRSSVPKVLHPLLGLPLLGHVLAMVGRLDIDTSIVVIGHGAGLVQDYLRSGRAVPVIQERQLGTGHAVLQAERALASFQGQVLILCGDAPLFKPETLEAFMGKHAASAGALSILSASMGNPTGYGRIVRSYEHGEDVDRIVEEKDATAAERQIEEINTGVYAVDKDFLFSLLGKVSRDNAQGEYYLTDIVALARNHGVSARVFCLASQEEAYGVNSRHDLSRAEAVLLDRIRLSHMARGVTLHMPSSIYIEADVCIGPDTVLEPHVVLKGRTRVGAGARIGAFSYLEDAVVGEGSVLPPFSNTSGGKAGC